MRPAYEQKQVIIDEISEKFNNSKSAVIVEYRGLSVAEMTNLRTQLREEGVDIKVYKNTLVNKAVEGGALADLSNDLTGPNAFAFGMEDEVAPARVLAKFAKKNKALVLKSGVFEGKVISREEVKTIASLPNKDALISMFASCLIAPLRNFGLVVKEIAKTQESGAE